MGNGSAMRVSPVGWFHDDLGRVLAAAARSAEVTHNHPEGIRGARAIAGAVLIARTGGSKADVRDFIATRIGYPLTASIAELQRHYPGGITCPDTVPPALTAFLDSATWEEAVRLAVSIGGDGDTIADMAGAVAEAFYGGVPPEVEREVRQRLAVPLLAVIDRLAAVVAARPSPQAPERPVRGDREHP